MYRVPPAGPWWPAVGAPLERGVRRHRENYAPLPAGFGFKRVRVEPMLGSLPRAQGVMPHPRGIIAASFETGGGRLKGRIELPPGVSGEFIEGTRCRELKPGVNPLG